MGKSSRCVRAVGLRAEMLRNWQEEQALEKIDAQVFIFVDFREGTPHDQAAAFLCNTISGETTCDLGTTLC